MSDLFAAFGIGLLGGLNPGPLHSLIISTALRQGVRPAVRLAFAPLISDLPPVLLSLWLAATMSDTMARFLAVGGGLFLIALGVRALLAGDGDLDSGEGSDEPLQDYARGAIVNILNPNPWIFWLGVGAPLLRDSWGRGAGYGVLWLGVFYVGLVGIKVVLAVILGRSRDKLPDRWLKLSITLSTWLMIGVGVWLLLRGVSGQI